MIKISKSVFAIVVILIAFCGFAADDLTTNKNNTIEDRINKVNPINTLTILEEKMTYGFSRHKNNNYKMDSIYARDGFLYVKTSSALEFYFNLKTVKDIRIDKDEIWLDY